MTNFPMKGDANPLHTTDPPLQNISKAVSDFIYTMYAGSYYIAVLGLEKKCCLQSYLEVYTIISKRITVDLKGASMIDGSFRYVISNDNKGLWKIECE